MADPSQGQSPFLRWSSDYLLIRRQCQGNFELLHQEEKADGDTACGVDGGNDDVEHQCVLNDMELFKLQVVVWAKVQPRNTEIWTELDAEGEAGRQEHVDHEPEDLEGGVALDHILFFSSLTKKVLFCIADLTPFLIIWPIGFIC